MEFELVSEVDRLVVTTCEDARRSFDDVLAEAHAAGALGPASDGDAAQLLRTLRPGPLGDLVASSALRVLAARRQAIDDSAVRRQLADWLDTHYHEKLAAYYTRPRTHNAFELLNAMTPVVPALEESMHSAAAALRSLDGVEHLRRELMRMLNGAAGSVVFRPFLPPAALGEQLRQVFEAAIELREAEESEAVNRSYRKLQAYRDELRSLVERNATQYGRTILLKAVEAMHEAAKRKIELRSPPARLTFDVSDRPLPLLESGVTATVALAVTNAGEAPAEGVVLNVRSRSAELVVPQGLVPLGRMEPQTRQSARVDVLVQTPITEAELDLEAQWTNVDHSVGSASESAQLRAHDVRVDWASLEGREPFANYPVELPEELVGRQRQLTLLRNAYSQVPLANRYVTGQRRVGKTSLVRVFVNELKAQMPKLCVADVELGEARGVDGATTIGYLGRKLAERIVRAADLVGDVPIPPFDDSLAPLTDVVEQILEWDAEQRFLFIIDEFDELPHETYRRGGAGDALFVPMRSLAQKPHVGWLLVGGEKMPFIRDEQATRLNNFHDLSLDYLDLHEDRRDEHGKDFGELVQRPLPPGFVVEDSAVRAIYDASRGNPHFAKELCATLFAHCVARRDAMVTVSEVQAAALATARERDVELFAHFWEDGIFDVEEERRRIELARREYLTALAHLLRAGTPATEERLRQALRAREIEAKEGERLRTEFVRRKILHDDAGVVKVNVPLFRLWLESEGIYKLPPKGLTEKIGEQLAADAEQQRVSSGEIGRLTKQWEKFKYRGERISREQVESWLEQFETPTEKRLAFRLLERIHVVTEAEIYAGLRRLHRQVASTGTVRLPQGQRSFSHVMVAGLGAGGSSGDSFAYTYRQANNIRHSNGVAADRLVDSLLRRTDVQAAILVDDFIGTGGTATAMIDQIAKRAGELHARSEVRWYLFAVSGRVDAAAEVANSRGARELGLEVELAFPLMEADMPLADKGTVFADAAAREQAVRMLQKYGEPLARWPLGYGDQCALIVFPDNCPNNCPPILWSDAADWRPLFSRTPR